MWYSADKANITGVTVGSTTSYPLNFPSIFRDSSVGTTVLDIAIGDADSNLASVFPPAAPQISDIIRIPLTRQAFMAEMFVDTRDAYAFELQNRVRGNAAFSDLVSIVTFGGRHPAVLNRIREDAVPGVLEAYRQTFFAAAEDEAGEIVYTPRYEQVREALASGVRAYVEGTGEPVRDALRFRSFLEQTGEADEALATLNALRDLYADMGQLGLTSREWSQVLYIIAAKVAPEGLKPDVLNMAVLGQATPEDPRGRHRPRFRSADRVRSTPARRGLPRRGLLWPCGGGAALRTFRS